MRLSALPLLLFPTPALAEDTGPDVVVQDLNVEGEVERAAVKEALDPLWDGVADCFTEARKQHPALGGLWTVRLVLDRKGRVETAVTSRSTVNAPALESCAIRALSELDVEGKPRDASVLATLHFRHDPAATPAPVLSGGPDTALLIGPPTVDGAPKDEATSEAVKAGLDAIGPRLQGCHAEALGRSDDISGRVTARLAADTVEILRSTLRDDTATRCVHAQLEAMDRSALGAARVTVNLDLALAH